MSNITIKINTENAAFENKGMELKRIFEKLAYQAENGELYDGKKIMDINGNSIGYIEID